VRISTVTLAAAQLLLLGTAVAQAPPREATVTTEQIAPGLHVLYGSGGGQVAGNVLVSIGAQGAVVVDTGFPQFVP
jgi:hypothetical protein